MNRLFILGERRKERKKEETEIDDTTDTNITINEDGPRRQQHRPMKRKQINM